MARQRRKKGKGPGKWSDTQRIELVTTWLATGNLALSAATHGIPEITARVWKTQPWFNEMVTDIRSSENLQLDSKLKKVVDKSVEQLLDRVENGDFQFDQKTGSIIRKPISARDAAKVTTDMIDRRELLQGKKEQITDSTRKVEDRLLKLAEEFSRFSKSKIVVNEPLTIEATL
jgi:hypothetical protein